MQASNSHSSIPQPTFPNKLWENLAPDIKQEAINQLKLVHLFKQINPELHVCPRETPANSLLEKGVQVPDRRLPFGRHRKQRFKKGGAYLGPGYRINNNMKNSNDASIKRRPFLAEQSLLRAEAPPHIPESVRKRAMSGQTLNTSTGSNNLDISEQSPSSDAIEQNEEKQSAEKTKDGDDQDEDNLKGAKVLKQVLTEDLQQNENEIDASVKTDKGIYLERRWGYFFCRTCLHAWVSGSVWCIKGFEKVYIQQTCNLCNQVVEPKVGGKFRESLFCEKWTTAVDILKSESAAAALCT